MKIGGYWNRTAGDQFLEIRFYDMKRVKSKRGTKRVQKHISTVVLDGFTTDDMDIVEDEIDRALHEAIRRVRERRTSGAQETKAPAKPKARRSAPKAPVQEPGVSRDARTQTELAAASAVLGINLEEMAGETHET